MSRQQDAEFRMVHFGTERVAEHRFVNNRVRTTLYVRGWLTPIIFFFKGVILEEFSKLANRYFAFVVLLQMWKRTTNTGGLPTVGPALTLIVCFASVLKLMQDLDRSRADHQLNTAKCERLVAGKFVATTWTDIKVGDFIKVHNREMLPADVVIFAAHEPDPENPVGACHVETKSLDGETNLKGRSVAKLINQLVGATPAAQIKALTTTLKGHIECEQPNAATTKFTGKIHIQGHPPVALNINNVLLRCCTVRNTDYVIGLVVNTGRDTKVMQGQSEPPLKASSLDRGINYLMAGIIVTQLCLCFIATLLRTFYDQEIESHWYAHETLGDDAAASIDFDTLFFGILRWFVTLAAFVSVSLYVSVDSNKAMMKLIMEKREEMVHGDTRLKVRTMTLIDELGCISHVFSDKTGTLTQNIMQFRKCSVAGKTYGRGFTEIGLARAARLGQMPPAAGALGGAAASGGGGGGSGGGGGGGGSSKAAQKEMATAPVNFDGPELFAALRGDSGPDQMERCREFVLHLALCHTVVVEQIGSEKRLSASSPDESALVSAAAHFGIEFVNKQHSTVTLRDTFTGKQPKFEVLEVLEFSSARKRMSVIVQEPVTGRIRLLSKGADSVMLPLVATASDGGLVVRETERHLEDHANDGLRTLILTEKTIDPTTYADWSKRYRAALVDLVELDKKERELPNEIERLMSEVEIGMSLVGSTAIEDKLQTAVPQTIADMGRAGIAVWVLTGDKEETAINIAYACELFDTRTKVHVINLKTAPDMAAVKKELQRNGAAARRAVGSGEKHALVIDGEVISMVLEASEMQLELLRMTLSCQSVIACRCAPSQKAQLVTLVRRNVKGAVTLAIGDGANDVAMIQAAHVGVGISGQEGMQAANSADFSVGQFRFLSELLFVWGRNAYRRMSTMIFYIFYKNVLLALIMYWYLFYSAAASTRPYIEAGLQGYNVIWTGLPIIFCTLYDRDVSDDLSRKLPQLYHLGVRRAYFNVGIVLRWVFDVIFESGTIFFVLIHATPTMVSPQGAGRDPGVTYLGDYAYALVLTVVTLKLALLQYQVSWPQHLCMAVCLFIWWPLSWLFNTPALGSYFKTYFLDYVGLFDKVSGNLVYWMLLLLIPVAVLMPQLFIAVYQRSFYPEFRDLAMELEFWKLIKGDANAQRRLEDWQIPLSQRTLPLRKDAPRPLKTRGFFSRMLSASK